MAISVGLGLGITYFGGAITNAIVAGLLAEASIPTVNGILASTSTATVDPDTGATVPVNTANGRSVRVGNVTLTGAALLAQGASTGLMGALTSGGNLASNTTAAGTYPSERTIIENTNNSSHIAENALVSVTDGVNYVMSGLLKAVGSRNAEFRFTDNSGAQSARVSVNLSTLVVTNVVLGTVSFIRGSAQALGNGFVLVQFVCSATAWGGTARMRLSILDASMSTSYTGDGVSGLIISGYDVTQADFARTPLAWDGSLGVSRVANLLSWNQALDTTAGTIIAQVMPWGRSGTVGGFSAIYNSSPLASAGRFIYGSATQTYNADRTDAIANGRSVSSAATPAVAGAQQAVTQRWDSVSNRVTTNGVTVSSGTPTLPFAGNTSTIIGNETGLLQPFEGHVFIAKWNRALTEAEVNAWIANTNILVP